MKRYAQGLRRPASAIAVLAAVFGVVLAGCSSGGSNSGSGSAGSGNSGGSGASSPASKSSGSGSGSGGATSVTSSSSVPFPIAVGNTWVYETTEGSAGAISSKRTDKIITVTPVSGGQQVTMSSKSDITGVGSTSQSTYIFHNDGSISYPFNQFSSVSNGQIKLISGGLFWPPASAIASGQPCHSTLKIEFTVAGQRKEITSHVTVQGAGTATVTVPAGTYSATIVNMTLAETVEGIGVSTEVKTWLAGGVGPVKSEVIIDEAGTPHVVSGEELISFTKG